MSTYCSSTDITAGLPTSHGISAGDLTIIIERASDLVDSALCNQYWAFPAVSATPATPGIIRTMALNYGQWIAWSEWLGASSRFDPNYADILLDRANKLAGMLMSSPPTFNIPPETVTDEALTFGTSPYESDEALLNCQPYDIKPESVRISGAEYGYVFTVYYEKRHRGWILQTKDTDVVTDGTTVTYEYTYMRRREQDLAPSVSSARLYRA